MRRTIHMRKKILLAMALTGLSALMITGCASPVIESKKEILESELGNKNL
jgi:ABC-type oligopeptide transport system substrate-binding subunit